MSLQPRDWPKVSRVVILLLITYLGVLSGAGIMFLMGDTFGFLLSFLVVIPVWILFGGVICWLGDRWLP